MFNFIDASGCKLLKLEYIRLQHILAFDATQSAVMRMPQYVVCSSVRLSVRDVQV